VSTVQALEGVLTPDPAEPVASLPFEVPPGCTRITLRYRHDPGHVLDLGLLDPAATPFPSAGGFRGWSGGARREAFVAPDEATPGYLAGPLPPGRWHVLLGRARVGPEGCGYRVEVEIEAEAPPATRGPSLGAAATVAAAPAAAPTAATPPSPDDPWYPGDLQSHTHHSDARGSVEELLAAAAARGLAFLAITDHNTVSHHAVLRRHAGGPVLPIPGMEVTTYRGHANVWGAAGWVDFRIASDADVAAMARRAHELGGLVSVNHPKTQPGCIGCDWTYAVPDEADALEAWQGPWWLRNWESLARYDGLLAGGRRLTLVGGSDRHQPAGRETDPPSLRVGSPTTWLQLGRLAVPDVLRALRAGRASVSEGPQGPRLEVRCGSAATGSVLGGRGGHEVRARVTGAAGERLRWVGARGVVREVDIERGDVTDAWTWEGDGPFLRAELVAVASLPARLRELTAWAEMRPLPYGITIDEVRAEPWRLALSNPLYT
jgi:hypothetical protein